LAARVRRSPLSPTEMLSTSFCTLISRIGFDCFFSDACVTTNVLAITVESRIRAEQSAGNDEHFAARRTRGGSPSQIGRAEAAAERENWGRVLVLGCGCVGGNPKMPLGLL
jgi:hypothetical protein